MSPIDTKFVKRIDNSYLMCRTLRHGWGQLYFGKLGGYRVKINTRFPSNTVVRVLFCTRCDTQRYDFFRTSGEFRAFYKRYVHSPGYLWRNAANAERPANQDYLKEALRRA